jgi:hypothetical protein
MSVLLRPWHHEPLWLGLWVSAYRTGSTRIVDDGIRFRDLRLCDCSKALPKGAVSLKLGIESDDVVNYCAPSSRGLYA